MKKVLIWYLQELQNTGGPTGYLYNIHEYLKTHPTDQIVFLTDIIKPHPYGSGGSARKLPFLKRIMSDIRGIINFSWLFYHPACPDLGNLNIDEYDYVHLHKVTEYFRFKKQFPRYKGKVILTNHCPCSWTDETLTSYDNWISFIRPIGIYNECKAYMGADYLMFPCKDAREPYEHDVSIKSVFSKNENKFFYVPSSILDISIDTEKMQKYSEIGIPENSFVITYFGRHNSIKGYDTLKKLGSVLLDKYPNLYILCAGRGEIEPLQHQRWIELGFINNTNELLLQSDLYISANKETYFDLVVLEILRSGTKLILSETGGNKYFKTLPTEEVIGIDFYKETDFDQLVGLVEDSIEMKGTSPAEYRRLCVSNRNLFLKYFTIDQYVNGYLDAINNLK